MWGGKKGVESPLGNWQDQPDAVLCLRWKLQAAPLALIIIHMGCNPLGHLPGQTSRKSVGTVSGSALTQVPFISTGLA